MSGDRTRHVPIPEVPDPPGTSRRELFTKAAIAAAVGAVAGTALSEQAQAADGDTFVLGATNTATSLTRLSGGSSLLVVDGSNLSPSGLGDIPASVIGLQTVDNRFGVLGEHTGAEGGVGVVGLNSSTNGQGVSGFNSGSGGVAVFGQHLETAVTGAGVVGVSQAGPGVAGNGSTADLLAIGSGRVQLQASGVSSPPSSAGTIGSIARDTAGNLWYCVATNSWRKLAGAKTAGAFHPIDPARVFDSRLAAYGALAGIFAPGSSRVIPVRDGRTSAGAVSTPDLVPPGATAIAYNVTVTGTTGPNFLSVSPGNATGYTASTINWTGAGAALANGSVVKLDTSRQIKVFCGDQSGSTHVIVDVVGYYL